MHTKAATSGQENTAVTQKTRPHVRNKMERGVDENPCSGLIERARKASTNNNGDESSRTFVMRFMRAGLERLIWLRVRCVSVFWSLSINSPNQFGWIRLGSPRMAAQNFVFSEQEINLQG